MNNIKRLGLLALMAMALGGCEAETPTLCSLTDTPEIACTLLNYAN